MSGMIIVTTSVVAILTALIIVAGVVHYLDSQRRDARSLLRDAEDKVVFLFDDTLLVDATRRARKMLRKRTADANDWDKFLGFFSLQFPNLRNDLRSLAQDRRKVIVAPKNRNLTLVAEYWEGLARIQFEDRTKGKTTLDQAAVAAVEDELHSLRTIAEDAPQLIWRQDEDGTIIWANRSYLDLATLKSSATLTDIPAWPPARLFDLSEHPATNGQDTIRIACNLPGSDPRWYDLRFVHRGSETVYFAIDVSAAVAAETAQRSHFQALTKTFAQLSTGLAIFDKARRLVTFNPALLDLTDLPIDFLSARPTLNSFLDHLREARLIPEPKNYSSWRDRIVSVETNASNGTFNERWDLPTGQTFRVTGRPHPNGAIAFLIEDISEEITLTRRFRCQIETSQAVLNQLEDAIAVFSPAGTLTLSNSAYQDLWHNGTEPSFVGSSLLEESRKWQKATVPTPVWARIRETPGQPAGKHHWTDTVRLNDGRSLLCGLNAMPGGNIMIRFALNAAEGLIHDPQPALWAAQS